MQRNMGPILRGNLSSDKRFEIGTGPRLTADGEVS